MNSQATRRFWKLYQELPADAQRLAVKNYQLWRTNPSHPSIGFRRLQNKSNIATVRIGDRYRALGELESNAVRWVWIGTHAEYGRMTS